MLLAFSRAHGYVNRNVAATLPRFKEAQAQDRAKGRLKVGVDILTPGEMRSILCVSQGRSRAMLLTLAFSGLCGSELRGLTWKHVDFGKSEISVCQRADIHHVIGPPKSACGYRTIPVPPIVINTLREWRLQCRPGDLDLVFPAGAGRIESHGNIVNRAWLPAQVKAGVVDENGKAKMSRPARDQALVRVVAHQIARPTQV